MRHAFADLLRNLRAGFRLATFRPVTRLEFRIDLVQLLVLLAVGALIAIVGDALLVEAPREFSPLGAGSEVYSAALMMLIAALVALINRQRELVLAIPVLLLAALPVPQCLQYGALLLASQRSWLGVSLDGLAILWIVVVVVRSVAVAFAPPPVHIWLRAIGAALLLLSTVWFANTLRPNDPWWIEAVVPAAPGGINAGSEAVLATQGLVLSDALDALAEERPGRTDLYFVGFAPYGGEDVFRKDVEAAQGVMDKRWGTAGRSLVLINNPRTLLTMPFATVTNLRETLNEVGAIIDPEDDVVMVYLASHGSSDHRLAALQPPLSLVELTPTGLRQLLDDAGIKWRIIVVSACYSGGYIGPLRNEHTLIVTASQADRVSFGCGDRSDATFFGEAFFQQGLAKDDSMETAFLTARSRVDAREKAEGYSPPSVPQIDVGSEMAQKLKGLGKRGGGATVLLRPATPPA